MRAPIEMGEAVARQVQPSAAETEPDTEDPAFDQACSGLLETCRLAIPFRYRRSREPLPFAHREHPDAEIKLTQAGGRWMVIQAESERGMPTDVPWVLIRSTYAEVRARAGSYTLRGKTVYAPVESHGRMFAEYFGLEEPVADEDVYALEFEAKDTAAAADLGRLLKGAHFDRTEYRTSRPLWPNI